MTTPIPAALADSPVIAVAAGELSDDLSRRTRQNMQLHGIPAGTDATGLVPVTDAPLDPPAEWQALADRKCGSCDGRGNWLDLPLHPGGEPIERDDCADCDGTGKEWVDVRVECPGFRVANVGGWVTGTTCPHLEHINGYITRQARTGIVPVMGNERLPRPDIYVWLPGDGSVMLGRLRQSPAFIALTPAQVEALEADAGPSSGWVGRFAVTAEWEAA